LSINPNYRSKGHPLNLFKDKKFNAMLCTLPLCPPGNRSVSSRLPESSNFLYQVVILTVDSHVDSLDLLTTLLTDYGARVIATTSTAEAMLALKTIRPDLLISEVYLPDEDGYSFMRRVKTLEAGIYKNLPAIALTVCAREQDRRLALAAGFCKHIAKPFDITSFMETVAQVVGISR
jgi:CheY-like chemotaxis protein